MDPNPRYTPGHAQSVMDPNPGCTRHPTPPFNSIVAQLGAAASGVGFGLAIHMVLRASQFLALPPASSGRDIFALNNFLDPSARAAKLMLHLGKPR